MRVLWSLVFAVIICFGAAMPVLADDQADTWILLALDKDKKATSEHAHVIVLDPALKKVQRRLIIDTTHLDTRLATTVRYRPDWYTIGKDSIAIILIQSFSRMAIQEEIRENLDQPFSRRYFRSFHISGWDDGDSGIINYALQPLQGTAYCDIFACNDPRSRGARPGFNREYVIVKSHQLIFATLANTVAIFGPGISQAALGGLDPEGTGKIGCVDLVATPIIGTGISIAEDVAHEKLISRMTMVHGKKRFLVYILAGVCTPTRVLSNALSRNELLR